MNLEASLSWIRIRRSVEPTNKLGRSGNKLKSQFVRQTKAN